MVQEFNYTLLLDTIGEVLSQARINAYQQINTLLVKTYREIGKYIVEFEQGGALKAVYGKKLLDQISKDLTIRYGKGFNRSNVIYMRQLYRCYPISATLTHQLTRTHYKELLKIDNAGERKFYEQQCIHERWSVRDLIRSKNTLLFQRSLGSQKTLQESELNSSSNQIIHPYDIVKDPYVLEFLGIDTGIEFSEGVLEQKIIDNLQKFIMELGKGFAFVGRQWRIPIGNRHFFVDLLFYHRILKCFVVIDLKVNEVEHNDIGQMNMYLNYLKKEEMTPGDNDPIGIILSTQKDETIVEYALGGITNHLFVSKYQLYLPAKDQLQKQIEALL